MIDLARKACSKVVLEVVEAILAVAHISSSRSLS